jgi:hypothetical protein
VSGEIPIIVQILDKDYRVACQDGQQDSLLASARFLDQKMREIRAASRRCARRSRWRSTTATSWNSDPFGISLGPGYPLRRSLAVRVFS